VARQTCDAPDNTIPGTAGLTSRRSALHCARVCPGCPRPGDRGKWSGWICRSRGDEIIGPVPGSASRRCLHGCESSRQSRVRFVGGTPVFLMNGRRHLYEGMSPAHATLLLRALLLEKGVQVVVVSNAAGGLNRCFEVGDLMLISDHVNWMFVNPLVGPNRPDWGVRFPDLSDLYSARLRLLAREAGQEAGVSLREGVYLGGLGPSYETRAEVGMLRGVLGRMRWG